MPEESQGQPLRILLHAPTPAALARARHNVTNLAQARPATEVRIIVNGEAVNALLDMPNPDTDCQALVCENSLKRFDRTAPELLQTVPASILAIAEMQRDGWCYIRA